MLFQIKSAAARPLSFLGAMCLMVSTILCAPAMAMPQDASDGSPSDANNEAGSEPGSELGGDGTEPPWRALAEPIDGPEELERIALEAYLVAGIDQLTASAESGDAEALFALSAVKEFGLDGQDADPDTALDLGERACAAGNRTACFHVANGRAEMPEPSDATLAEAEEILRDACAGADHYACTELATHLQSGTFGEPDPAQAVALVMSGCNAGSAYACRLLVQAHRNLWNSTVRRDVVAVMKAFSSACDNGSLSSCIEGAHQYSFYLSWGGGQPTIDGLGETFIDVWQNQWDSWSAEQITPTTLDAFIELASRTEYEQLEKARNEGNLGATTVYSIARAQDRMPENFRRSWANSSSVLAIEACIAGLEASLGHCAQSARALFVPERYWNDDRIAQRYFDYFCTLDAELACEMSAIIDVLPGEGRSDTLLAHAVLDERCKDDTIEFQFRRTACLLSGIAAHSLGEEDRYYYAETAKRLQACNNFSDINRNARICKAVMDGNPFSAAAIYTAWQSGDFDLLEEALFHGVALLGTVEGVGYFDIVKEAALNADRDMIMFLAARTDLNEYNGQYSRLWEAVLPSYFLTGVAKELDNPYTNSTYIISEPILEAATRIRGEKFSLTPEESLQRIDLLLEAGLNPEMASEGKTVFAKFREIEQKNRERVEYIIDQNRRQIERREKDIARALREQAHQAQMERWQRESEERNRRDLANIFSRLEQGLQESAQVNRQSYDQLQEKHRAMAGSYEDRMAAGAGGGYQSGLTLTERDNSAELEWQRKYEENLKRIEAERAERQARAEAEGRARQQKLEEELRKVREQAEKECPPSASACAL